MKMYQSFKYFIFIFFIMLTMVICGEANKVPPYCTICQQVLLDEYSIDAWKNPFHSYHEKDGIFCHSCSRIISQGITHGGFRYADGRYLCSLCQISGVETDSIIHAAYHSVIKQFMSVGILNIPTNIPIALINLIELNKKIGTAHGNLKGFTHTDIGYQTQPLYKIYILFGLPKIEFEAVLAHELLHIWLHQSKIKLSPNTSEGFCNLGSYLIYKNDNTQFSNIHLQAMETSNDLLYGKGYRKIKNQLEQLGWKKLITNLSY